MTYRPSGWPRAVDTMTQGRARLVDPRKFRGIPGSSERLPAGPRSHCRWPGDASSPTRPRSQSTGRRTPSIGLRTRTHAPATESEEDWMISAASVQRAEASLPRAVWWRTVVLGVVMAASVGFLLAFALPHIAPDARRYARYRVRRSCFLLHIGSGAVALLGRACATVARSGPTTSRPAPVSASFTSAASPWDPCQRSIYLHTDFGWLFGMGLTGLAVAWLVTTGLALASDPPSADSPAPGMDDPQLRRDVCVGGAEC